VIFSWKESREETANLRSKMPGTVTLSLPVNDMALMVTSGAAP
jgi:hypothetical protein